MMETVGFYLLKSTLVSGIFYLIYYALFRKESFFALNRLYLLTSLLFAYSFPFVSISVPETTVQELPMIASLQSGVNHFRFTDEAPAMAQPAAADGISPNTWFWLAICIVSALFLFRFIRHIIQLYKTIQVYETIKEPDYTLVLFDQKNTFSFFRYIFISPFVRHSPDGTHILAHELSHLKHLHSLDRLIIELLNIVFWMNPFIYLYRKELEEVHEYQADRDANQNDDSLKSYFELVLRQASDSAFSPLMSPFSYQLIKKRIKMSTHKSNPLKKLILIVPVVIGLIILTSSAIQFQSLTPELYEQPASDLSTPAETNSASGFILPLDEASITGTMGYGNRIHPVYKVEKFHLGVDFKAELNTPVYASQTGKVTLIKSEKTGYGKRIELEHDDNYKTLYAHLNSFNVKDGATVQQGDIIGYVGNTGASTAPHLHFEVHKDGKAIDPQIQINRLTYLTKNQTLADNATEHFTSPLSQEDLIKRSSGYGMRIHPIYKDKRMHNGVDYVGPVDANILAIGDGIVRTVSSDFIEGKGYGRFVIVDHANGYSSLYSQLSAYKVEEGQNVKQGDVIGLLGNSGLSTAPHLHLEIKKDNQFIDPESVMK